MNNDVAMESCLMQGIHIFKYLKGLYSINLPGFGFYVVSHDKFDNESFVYFRK